MKGNTWLAGFAVFALLLIGAAGFFFAKGFGKYRAEFNGWDELASQIARLERESPYPNAKNEKELETKLVEYEGNVKSLYQSLAKFQKPLDETMQDRDFPQKLKTKVEGFLNLAKENGLTIGDQEEFYLGFNAYSSSLPKPSLVPLLNYQLDAISHLLTQLVESGVSGVVQLSREPLPGEDPSVGSADIEDAADSVVQKFPVKLDFVGRHQGFQGFVNRITNDNEYFFILRALRVENSASEGPEIAEGAGEVQFVHKDTGETAPRELLVEKGIEDMAMADFIPIMLETGYKPINQDARILFGEEDVEVEAVFDLVRFLPPEEAAKKEDAKEDGAQKN